MVPTNIGPFEIIGRLGGGARGTVYRARHVSHGRIVAIKQLSATVAEGSPEFDRLWNEVARLRAVVSNHVAATHSVELIDGRPVIETESLGESLEKVSGQQSLALPDALRAVQDALSGLKVLHAAGITHGNLRPSNVLQDTTTGNWKLVDGGIAGIEAGTSPTLLATSLLYVAPEVLTRRAEPGERSDLYAVGMLGLQAALGTARLNEAFPEVSNLNSPSRWLTWIEHSTQEALPLHVLNPDTPEPVSRFLSKLLSKDPAARFPSAFAALVELEAILPLVSPGKSEMAPAEGPVETHAGPGASTGTIAAARLLIAGPGGFQQQVELSNRTYRLGREPQNDIVLPDETKAVSRIHAELRYEGGRHVLHDLDSQNGLVVGGRRKPSVQLQPGVVVKIGDYAISLSAVAAAADVQPSRAKAAPAPAAAGVAIAWWPPKTAAQWAIVVGIPVLAVAGIIWVVTRDSPSDEPTPIVTVETTDAAKEPTPPPELTARERSLATIRQLLEKKEFAMAAQEADLLLTLDPQDAEARALKKEASAGIEQKKRPADSRGARASKPVAAPTPGYQGVAPRRAGESEADWIARDHRLNGTNASATQAMEAGDFRAALALWQSIKNEEPAYPNLDARMTAARARLNQAVQTALQAGQAFEKSGDLLRARASFQRARDLDADSVIAQSALAALAVRMRKEGERAFRDGQDNENYQKLAEARLAYQKAFDYLPDDHPSRKLAKAALDRIGR